MSESSPTSRIAPQLFSRFALVSHVFCAIVLLLCGQAVIAQEWSGIRPLSSTCKDVKRLLGLTKCQFPVTRFQKPTYEITIHFSTENGQWSVSKNVVVDLVVIFKDLLPLRKYTSNLSDFTETWENDAPEIKIYKNKKKGVDLTVQTIASEEYLSNIFIYPSSANKRKYRRVP